METENDRIRRELGFDLIEEARRQGVREVAPPPAPKPAPPSEEAVVTILDND